MASSGIPEDPEDDEAFDRASVAQAGDLWRKRDGRSQVFGAWLDDDMITNVGTTDEDDFSRAIAAMRRGQYRAAVAGFERAIEQAGGEGGSKGGQISVWLAQAYNAAGDLTLAIELLDRLEHTHPNRNVRKAATEIGFILRSPRLELDENNFVTIPEEIQRAPRRGRQEPEYAKMEPPPERYSLEWYMEQDQVDPKAASQSTEQTVAAAAVTVGGLVVGVFVSQWLL